MSPVREFYLLPVGFSRVWYLQRYSPWNLDKTNFLTDFYEIRDPGRNPRFFVSYITANFKMEGKFNFEWKNGSNFIPNCNATPNSIPPHCWNLLDGSVNLPDGWREDCARSAHVRELDQKNWTDMKFTLVFSRMLTENSC